MSRTQRKRVCRTCTEWFDDPGPGQRDAPAGYCTVLCWSNAKPHPTGRDTRPALRKAKAPAKRRAVSPAAPEQRAAVRDRACLVCRGHQGECHPAHLIDRSLCTEGADDPRATVPLCPRCHREYDEGGLDLLPYLEPHHRDVLAFAVSRVGLVATLRRVTNEASSDRVNGTGRTI